MPDDYATTADCMMRDAQTLFRAGAHRNACYLAGYVAECTLKRLLERTGERAGFTHDLVALQGSLQASLTALRVQGDPGVARYGDPQRLAPTMLQQVSPATRDHRGNPKHSCHWDPYHRYDGTRWADPAMADAYQREAERCIQILNQLALDDLNGAR